MVSPALEAGIGAQGHAPAAPAKDAHGPKDSHAASDAHAAAEPKSKAAPPAQAAHASHDDSTKHAATLKPPAHKLAAPAAPKQAAADTHPPSDHPTKTPVSQVDGKGPRAAGHEADREAGARPTRDAPRPPNPALEAVLQRITRRISGARTERAVGSPAPQAAVAASPAFRVQVTAPASVAALTPRVRLTWRPTVVWPRAVLPAADADARVRIEWAAGH